MSTLQKVHVFSAGGSALVAGALAAALGGWIAGPPGVVVGAAIGGALGAFAGQKFAAARDVRGDLGHFEQIYRKTSYYVDGMTWEDYGPAYRYGLRTHKRHGHGDFNACEAELEADWSGHRGASRLSWQQARHAVAHAWRELEGLASTEPAAGDRAQPH